MTLSRAFVPDPEPSPHGQAPSSAAHPNLPADESVWAAARRSYVEAGCSSEVVAERHGLNARTVRHHARGEGWAEMRALHRAVARRCEAAAEPEEPELALMAEKAAEERMELLLWPSAAGSQRVAASRMQEALARGAPQEARQWQQVFAGLQRHAEALDRAFLGLDANDRARLMFYRSLAADEEEPPPG